MIYNFGEIQWKKLVLKIGDTFRLGKIRAYFHLLETPIKWETSNAEVVAIDQYAQLLIAKNVGNAKITIKNEFGNQIAELNVVSVIFEDKVTIYRSPILAKAKKEKKDTIDMIYRDKSKEELLSINPILYDLASLYDSEVPDSEKTTQHITLFEQMYSLINRFCYIENETKRIAESIIHKFWNGNSYSENSYSENISTLSVIANEHRSISNMKMAMRKIVINAIKQNPENPMLLATDSEFSHIIDQLELPHFKNTEDMYTGLWLILFRTVGIEIILKDYCFDGKKFKTNIHYVIHCHFSITENDVSNENICFKHLPDAFGSWYVLQHYSGCKSTHKPLAMQITAADYLEADVSE